MQMKKNLQEIRINPIVMGVRRNFSRGGQRQHSANHCQVADDAISYVHETLNLFYTPTPQRKRPMLRQQSQKCACLASIANELAVFSTVARKISIGELCV